jgi:hypothetical protein
MTTRYLLDSDLNTHNNNIPTTRRTPAKIGSENTEVLNNFKASH